MSLNNIITVSIQPKHKVDSNIYVFDEGGNLLTSIRNGYMPRINDEDDKVAFIDELEDGNIVLYDIKKKSSRKILASESAIPHDRGLTLAGVKFTPNSHWLIASYNDWYMGLASEHALYSIKLGTKRDKWCELPVRIERGSWTTIPSDYEPLSNN